MFKTKFKKVEFKLGKREIVIHYKNKDGLNRALNKFIGGK